VLVGLKNNKNNNPQSFGVAAAFQLYSTARHFRDQRCSRPIVTPALILTFLLLTLGNYTLKGTRKKKIIISTRAQIYLQKLVDSFLIPRDRSICRSYMTGGTLGHIGKLDLRMFWVFCLIAVEMVVSLVMRPPEKHNCISVGKYYVIYASCATEEVPSTLVAAEEMFYVSADS